jgi:L-iditol 2-dehydrogenase
VLANILVEPGMIEQQEITIPSISAGEVLVKIKAALTCGTDLKAFRRGHQLMPMPTVFGHEFSGDIVDIGDRVTKFNAGESVMAVHTAPCGVCSVCERHLENLCPTMMENKILGAYAEYIRVPEAIVQRNLYSKPDHLPYREAAILEPLACVVYGMEQTNLLPGDTVVILGAGAIGLLHVMVAKAMGAGRVIVSGHHEYRLDLARQVGADVAFDSTSSDAIDRIADETAGEGAPLVIECTGQPSVWESATFMASRGGTVILFGGCPSGSTVTFDTSRLHYDQITLKGVFHFTPEAVRAARDLLCAGKINVSPLITADRPLSDLPLVFEDLMKGDCVKFALIP